MHWSWLMWEDIFQKSSMSFVFETTPCISLTVTRLLHNSNTKNTKWLFLQKSTKSGDGQPILQKEIIASMRVNHLHHVTHICVARTNLNNHCVLFRFIARHSTTLPYFGFDFLGNEKLIGEKNNKANC